MRKMLNFFWISHKKTRLLLSTVSAPLTDPVIFAETCSSHPTILGLVHIDYGQDEAGPPFQENWVSSFKSYGCSKRYRSY